MQSWKSFSRDTTQPYWFFATKVCLQVILEALRFIYYNRCKMLSMQISLTSLTLLQRSGQNFLPSGLDEQQNSRIARPKSYSPALNTSGISWKGRTFKCYERYSATWIIRIRLSSMIFAVGFRRVVLFRGVSHPEYDVKTLKVLAKGLNKSVLAQVKSTEADEVAESTWATTLAEERLGWIWRDPDQNLEGKVVAKRFGLQQKNKIRVIDDCSVCGLNAACGIKERFKYMQSARYAPTLLGYSLNKKVALATRLLEMTFDLKCCVLGWFLFCVFSSCFASAWRCFDLYPRVLDDRQCFIARSAMRKKNQKKTFDLKSAYRQFCICKEDRDLARIMVFDTDKRVPTTFGLNVLPFGAVGSVAGFLRVSLALHFIGVVGLHLAWTAFYDDFTIVTSLHLKNSSELAASSLFDLLGVIFAKEGDKCMQFSESFKTLGVMVDFSKSADGRAYLGHTESRKEELQHMLSDVLAKGSIDAKLAESLRGRMQWFETFAQGRVANSAVKKLGDLALTGRRTVHLIVIKIDRRCCFFVTEFWMLHRFALRNLLSKPG